MGWHEWPLVVFTVVTQAAVGAFWWCCIALLTGGLSPDQASLLEGRMLVIWALMALAFSVSAFHLGSPMRALSASFRFGRAPLSNEVVFGSAFIGLGLIGWVIGLWDIGTAASRVVVLGLAVACSLAFLTSMIWFYMLPTVPTWYTPLTPAAYILTVLIGGSAVAAALFAAAGITQPGLLHHGPVTLVSLAMIATIFVTLSQGSRLTQISSSIKRASDLSPNYAGWMALRFLILSLALVIWWIDMLHWETLYASSAVACLILIAEMVGRSVHFKLHMTVGIR